MSWTDERVERLKAMWAEGLTASQIAKDLGEVTRNAVIGKVHRLGLSGRTKSTRKPVKRTVKTAKAAAEVASSEAKSFHGSGGGSTSTIVVGNTVLKTEIVSQPSATPNPRLLEELVIPLHQRASILQLTEHRCKWPIGDPTHEDFHYCGRQKDPTKSYCEHHCGVAYQSQDRRR